MKIQVTAQVDTDSQNDRELVEEIVEFIQKLKTSFDEEADN